MGKELEQEEIHVYVWLNPFALHLKLTQHCKSTIHPYKIKSFLKCTLLLHKKKKTQQQRLANLLPGPCLLAAGPLYKELKRNYWKESLGLPWQSSGEDPVFSSRGAWAWSLVGRNWVQRYLRSHRSKVSKVRCKERKPDQSTNERKLASR